jgi:hypothetical protein
MPSGGPPITQRKAGLKVSGAMHIALVIYGSLDEVSGSFLYDRKLVEHLQQRGHEVTVIPLPWRSYWWSLVANGSYHLLRRMQGREFAVIVQDELIHPSVFQLNQRLRRVVQTPIVALGLTLHPDKTRLVRSETAPRHGLGQGGPVRLPKRQARCAPSFCASAPVAATRSQRSRWRASSPSCAGIC